MNIQLGYSANEKYMNYLVNKDVKELRGLMQRILDSKMPNNNLSASDSRQGSEKVHKDPQEQKDPLEGYARLPEPVRLVRPKPDHFFQHLVW